jgi:hypothetical protein
MYTEAWKLDRSPTTAHTCDEGRPATTGEHHPSMTASPECFKNATIPQCPRGYGKYSHFSYLCCRKYTRTGVTCVCDKHSENSTFCVAISILSKCLILNTRSRIIKVDCTVFTIAQCESVSIVMSTLHLLWLQGWIQGKASRNENITSKPYSLR